MGVGVGGWVEGGWSWLGILVWVFSSDTAPRSGGGIYLSWTPRARIRPLYPDPRPKNRDPPTSAEPSTHTHTHTRPLGLGHGIETGAASLRSAG